MPAVVVVALVLALTAGGSSEPESAATAPATVAAARVDRFDSARAWKHAEPPGRRSARAPPARRSSRKLAGYLRERLPRGHYEAVPGHPGLRNVVGRIPGAKPADRRSPRTTTPRTCRASSAPTTARAARRRCSSSRARCARLKRPKGAPEIRFVFFDGEEATDDTQPFEATGAARLEGLRASATRDELRALVLLDFVAEKGAMRIPREAGSDAKLWARLREAAKRAGVGRGVPAPG